MLMCCTLDSRRILKEAANGWWPFLISVSVHFHVYRTFLSPAAAAVIGCIAFNASAMGRIDRWAICLMCILSICR